MTKRETIRANAIHLQEGDTESMFCPFCQASHEEKLYVTRLGGGKLAYQCKRASCGEKGIITGTRGEGGSPPKQFKPKYLDKETRVLSSETQDYIEEKYQIPRELLDALGVLQSVSGDEIFFPIYKAGKRLAWTSKRLRGYGKKSIVYKEVDESLFFEVTLSGQNHVVIVEDCLSAMKVANVGDGMNAIALIGTHLSSEVIRHITTNYTKVFVALDADAVNTQRKMVRHLNMYIDTVDVFLPQDPKDTPIEDLRRHLGI